MQTRTLGRRLKPLASISILGLALAAPAGAQVGELDPTFGGGDGIVMTDERNLDLGFDILLEPDGRVLIAGRTEIDGPTTRDAIVVRYNAGGSVNLVQTHGIDGCGGGPDTPDGFFALGRESDGNILAAGFVQFGCTGGGGERDFWVARLDSSDLQNNFNFEFPSFTGATDTQADNARDLLIQPDGKVVAVGRTNTSDVSSRDFAIARWEPDGDLDPSFSGDGVLVIDFAGDNDIGLAAALQNDGKIIIVGNATVAGQPDAALARLLPNGNLDATFGSGGKVTTDFAGLNDGARAVVVQADGKILVAGFRTAAGGARDAVVLRYTAAGVLDAGFGSGGAAVVDFGTLPSQLLDIFLQPDGKILVAGITETGAGGFASRDFAIARLNPDGSLDSSFAGDGRQTIDITGSDREDVARSIALQTNDGGILVGGSTRDRNQSPPVGDLALIRLIGDAFTPGATVTPTSGLITTEAGGSDTFSVVLDSRPVADVTIGLSSTNTNEGTVNPTALTFTSTNWDTPQTVTVGGVDDSVVDGDQLYTIVTAAASSADATYNGIDPDDVAVTNQDNDASVPDTLQFTATPFTAGEADGNAAITISRMGSGNGFVSVVLETADGSATEPDDYTATTQVATWNDGDMTDKTVNVPILEDSLVEGNETVNLSLINPDGNAVVGSPGTATLIITDNDAVPPPPPEPSVVGVSLSATQVQEENPSAKSAHTSMIIATLDQASSSNVTVTLGFSGQAQSGVDFSISGNPIMIPAGSTSGSAQLAVVDDTLVEGDESFAVVVQSATGAQISDPPPQVNGVIIDNDQAQAITATPIPTLTAWGLLLTVLLVPVAGWWWLRRRAV